MQARAATADRPPRRPDRELVRAGRHAIAGLTFVVWLFAGPQPALNYALINAIGCWSSPVVWPGLATPTAVLVGTGKGAQNRRADPRAALLETATSCRRSCSTRPHHHRGGDDP